jgi:hypothetical protein
MTPQEKAAFKRLVAMEQAQKSIKGADGVIDTAMKWIGEVAARESSWSREERVATIARFLIEAGNEADPYAPYVVAGRAIDRLIEMSESLK